jgi:hypothetical protein
MTAQRAAVPTETDVIRARQSACLVSGAVPWQARQRGRAAQPEAFRALEPRPESVGAAREFTRATLAGWGMAALCDDAELVISELVTNALRHALAGPGGAAPPGRAGDAPVIRLRLLAQAPYLMCMVSDPSRAIPMPREPGPEAIAGRGLQVIESCSSRWGWHLLDDGGKVVWALLPGA